MPQIPKFQQGGKSKSPKNIDEYNKLKQKAQDEYNKKEQERTVLLNGKRYAISDVKNLLSDWRGSEDAMELRSSYRRRGDNVNSNYSKFLDSLEKGDIREIEYNADNGFTLKFNDNAEQFIPEDKYASDYITRAIRSNLNKLSPFDNAMQDLPKVDLTYNPQKFIEDLYGGQIDQGLYEKETTADRIQNVIHALRNYEANLDEYYRSEDKEAFDGVDTVPFENLDELEQYITALGTTKSGEAKPEFDEEEQKYWKKLGPFFRNYIYGKQTNQVSATKPQQGNPQQDIKTREAAVRKANNLPEGAPLQYKYGNTTIVATGDGLRQVGANGELIPLRGYFNFQASPDTYMLPSGFYDTKHIPYENLQEYVKSNQGFMFDVYTPAIQKFRAMADNIKFGKADERNTGSDIFNQLSRLLNLGQNEFGVEYLNPVITHSPTGEKYDIFSIYNKENIDSALNQGRPFSSDNMYAIDKETGDIWQGKPIFKNGYMYLQTKYGDDVREIPLNTLNRNPVDKDNKPLPITYDTKTLEKRLNELLEKYGFQTGGFWNKISTANNESLNNLIKSNKEGGKIELKQEGGIIGNVVDTKSKTAATTSNIFDSSTLSTADKADLTALALDVAGLASTAIAGIGNVAGAVSGIGSSVATAIADYKRDDEFSWGDVGTLALNLGMDVATVIPGLGSVAKGAKVVKRLKSFAPVLHKLFIGAGLGQAAYALTKAVSSDEELTINDWRLLASGLTALTGAARGKIGKKLYTQPATNAPVKKALKAKAGDVEYEVNFKNNEVDSFNNLSKKDKLEVVKKKIVEQSNGSVKKEDLNNLKLNEKVWYNPITYTRTTKLKGDKSNIELNEKAIEGLNSGKYGWFKRGLIAEQANYAKSNNGINTQLEGINQEVRIGKGGNPTIKEKVVVKGSTTKVFPSTETSTNINKSTTPETKQTKKSRSQRIREAQEKNAQDPELSKIREENKKKQEAEKANRRAAYQKGQETKRKKILGYKDDNLNLTKTIPGITNAPENVNIGMLVDLKREQREIAKLNSSQSIESPTPKKPKKSKKPKKQSKDVNDRVKKRKDGGVLDFYSARNSLILDRDKYEIGSNEWIKLNAKVKEFTRKFENGGNFSLVDFGKKSGGLYEYNQSQKAPLLNTTLNLGETVQSPKFQKYTNISQLPDKKKFNMSVPVSTASSILSAIQRTNANNKIYKTLREGLKPVLLDTPTDLNYSVQGNQLLKEAYYKQASNLEGLTRKNLTSDADRQLAFNLDVAKEAANTRLQGDLANAQAIQQSRDKAFEVGANNLARRESVNNANKQSVTNYLNQLTALKAQKIAQNSDIWDTFLHDVSEQTIQGINMNKSRQGQEDYLNQQLKNARTTTDNQITAQETQRALEELYKKYNNDLNKVYADPEYKRLRGILSTLNLDELKRNINLQKLGINLQYPAAMKKGGKINSNKKK